MSEPVLEVKNLEFAYEQNLVLDQVSFMVKQGEFLGIVGPNGSGKSTLLKLILGFLKPNQGTIERKSKQIGYVSQKANSFNLGFPATVSEVVSSGLTGKIGLFRRFTQAHKQKVSAAIEQVGLKEYQSQNIGQLSGGQQQRVFIARALVAEPKLLILDEPTVGVDAKSTQSFYELLQELHQKEKISLVMVTHDIGVITRYVDRLACLNRKLFFHGHPDDFQQRQQEILSATYGHDIQILEHHH